MTEDSNFVSMEEIHKKHAEMTQPGSFHATTGAFKHQNPMSKEEELKYVASILLGEKQAIATKKNAPGWKDDDKKVRLDLIPHELTIGLGHVLTFGAHKYGNRNWEAGMRWGRVYAALQRHLTMFWSGEANDPETGMPHLAHAAACIAFLMAYENRKIGEDDRPFSAGNPAPILRGFDDEPETGTDDHQQAFWDMMGMGLPEVVNVAPAPLSPRALQDQLDLGRTLFENWAAEKRMSPGNLFDQLTGDVRELPWEEEPQYSAAVAYIKHMRGLGF